MKRLHFDPLPGSVPYENRREIHVKARFEGLRFIDFLCQYHPPTPRDAWQHWIDAGDILIDSFPARAARTVRTGDCFVHVMRDVVEPEVRSEIRVLHEDESLLVIDKPAPLPMHPSGRFNRNTLLWMLEKAYVGEKLRIAHRLDANTTGTVVLCRTALAASIVQPQFERREVDKRYLVRAVGHIPWREYRCQLKIAHAADAMGVRHSLGARITDPGGQSACTHFQTIDRLPDHTTLLQATPLSGRTNQIRVHLWSLGFPIVGDLLYQPNGQLGNTQTLSLSDPPMCLHAHRLSLMHPTSGEPVTYESKPPSWFIPQTKRD